MRGLFWLDSVIVSMTEFINLHWTCCWTIILNILIQILILNREQPSSRCSIRWTAVPCFKSFKRLLSKVNCKLPRIWSNKSRSVKMMTSTAVFYIKRNHWGVAQPECDVWSESDRLISNDLIPVLTQKCGHWKPGSNTTKFVQGNYEDVLFGKKAEFEHCRITDGLST